MRKIFITIGVLSTLLSCSIENEQEFNNSENLTAQISESTDTYKGVFTTIDSKYRGIINIEFPKAANKNYKKVPVAEITLQDGQVITAYARKNASIDSKSGIHFSSKAFSFNFISNGGINNAEIKDVIFNNKEANAIVKKHSEFAPVTPVTGTYECGTCNSHPVLGSGVDQTFNFVIETADGDSIITTQMAVGTTTFNGIGFQEDCIDTSVLTRCNLESGDITTTSGFEVNGNPVTWSGMHTLNNEVTGPDDCSTITGNWQWESISYGTINGTFISDPTIGCPTILGVLDFDQTQPLWGGASDIPFFDNGADGFFGVTGEDATGNPAAASNINFPNITGDFLFVNDLDDEGNGTADDVTITSAIIDTTNFEDIEVTFDYQILGFDSTDKFTYTLILDGVTLPNTKIGGIDTGDGLDQQDRIVLSVPDATNSVQLILTISQNGEDEYAAFDNFTIIGKMM